MGKTLEELFGEDKAAQIKNKLSIIASKRTGQNNPFYGKHHSKKTKDKLSENKLNKYNGNQNKPIIINGIVYLSLSKASKATGISLTTIRWRVLSKNKKFTNYKYLKEN